MFPEKFPSSCRYFPVLFSKNLTQAKASEVECSWFYSFSKDLVSGKYLVWMLETNSPDWTRLRRLHRHTIDLPTGLQEATDRFKTLSGLDGDPAPHGRMLAALRDPRLTRSQTDLGWSRMEDSLASLPHRSPWDSEVFIVPSALAITLEMGRRGNLGIFLEVDFTQIL